MDFAFKTKAEFTDYFKDEKTCYKFLENLRWSDGTAVCPHCERQKNRTRLSNAESLQIFLAIVVLKGSVAFLLLFAQEAYLREAR